MKPTYTAEFVTSLLVLTNSALNPFIFMLLNRDFRYALRLTIARIVSHVPGQADAVHHVRLSYHGDSMVDSQRVPSRCSGDSGVEMETGLTREPSIKDNRLCPPEPHMVHKPKPETRRERSPRLQAASVHTNPRTHMSRADNSQFTAGLLAPPSAPRGRTRRSRDKLVYDAKALNRRRVRRAILIRTSSEEQRHSEKNQDTDNTLHHCNTVPGALGGLLGDMYDMQPGPSSRDLAEGSPHEVTGDIPLQNGIPGCSRDIGGSLSPEQEASKGTYMNRPIPIIILPDDDD